MQSTRHVCPPSPHLASFWHFAWYLALHPLSPCLSHHWCWVSVAAMCPTLPYSAWHLHVALVMPLGIFFSWLREPTISRHRGASVDRLGWWGMQSRSFHLTSFLSHSGTIFYNQIKVQLYAQYDFLLIHHSSSGHTLYYYVVTCIATFPLM